MSSQGAAASPEQLKSRVPEAPPSQAVAFCQTPYPELLGTAPKPQTLNPYGVLVNGVVAGSGQQIEVPQGRVKLEVVMSVKPDVSRDTNEGNEGKDM